MAKVLATVSGTALAPGVSKNGRLYTREAIARAVQRAQGQLAEGKTLSVLTHHDAGDDSERIIGRITGMSVAEDGSARFTADLADTPRARTIATLADSSSGQPFLSGMSIRGQWLGKVKRVAGPSGGPVETADDLEFFGIDPTHKPGVEAAGIDTFAWAKGGASETTERVLITESVEEARLTAITEEVAPESADAPAVAEAAAAQTPAPAGTVYADPGYLADKKKRYPLNGASRIRAAWSYINQKANAAQYTPAQLKRIKGRIKAAMKQIGATVTSEGWVIWPAEQVTEATVTEYIDDAVPAGAKDNGSFSVCATNGPVTVEVRSYCVDPADLGLILRAAADGACQALAALDPDMDADIDVPGADAEDTDGDMAGDTSDQVDNGDGTEDIVRRLLASIRGESAEDLDAILAEARQQASAAVTETAPEPAPEPAAEPQETGEEPAVSEATTNEAVQAPAAASIPQDAIDRAIAKAAKKAVKAALRAAAPSAPSAPAESAPAAPAAVTESDDERIARIVEERLAAARAAEGTAPVAETEEQRVERMVQERLTAERQAATAAGNGPGRKGLVTEHSASRETEVSTAFMKDGQVIPMEQWTEDQRAAAGAALQTYILGDRAVF